MLEPGKVTVILDHVIAPGSLRSRRQLHRQEAVGFVRRQRSGGQKAGPPHALWRIHQYDGVELGGIGRLEEEGDVAHHDPVAPGPSLGEQPLPASVHFRMNDAVEIGQRARIRKDPGPKRRPVEGPV